MRFVAPIMTLAVLVTLGLGTSLVQAEGNWNLTAGWTSRTLGPNGSIQAFQRWGIGFQSQGHRITAGRGLLLRRTATGSEAHNVTLLQLEAGWPFARLNVDMARGQDVELDQALVGLFPLYFGMPTTGPAVRMLQLYGGFGYSVVWLWNHGLFGMEGAALLGGVDASLARGVELSVSGYYNTGTDKGVSLTVSVPF